MVVLVDLMSVKPNRRADEGAAMVGWTLDGCISDIGGFLIGAAEGVWGGRGRVGEDMTALRFWVLSASGLSSCSATESRLGEWDSLAGVCHVVLVNDGHCGLVAVCFDVFVYLPWRR